MVLTVVIDSDLDSRSGVKPDSGVPGGIIDYAHNLNVGKHALSLSAWPSISYNNHRLGYCDIGEERYDHTTSSFL